FILLSLAALLAPGCARKKAVPDVIIAADAGWHERTAAAEIRRYIYLRTGILPALKEIRSFAAIADGAVAVIEKAGSLARGIEDAGVAARIADLGPEDYWLKTVGDGSRRIVLVAGGGGPGVLYGAYQLAEMLGVRFGLEGDIVPDGTVPMPRLDLDETGRPLFAVRGIQPFHDFPEGPDWWTLEGYKAIIGQLPKLRMNFFGLHTYPENPNKEHGATPNAEPTVWIGREGEYRPDGAVTASYPSSYQNTARGNWGYESKKTGDFHFGAGLLFERDDFGNDVMDGFSPDPATPEASNEVFNRAAAVFRNAFGLARRLGVRTCVGTETALTVPDLVKKRLADSGLDPKDPAVVKGLYKAMFGRIAAAYPVDYYWLWTNEGWTWDDASPEAIKAVTTDLDMAVQAWKEAAPPFRLATCGWVLGPPSNRTLFDQVLPKDVALSTINREVGKAPVDPGFSRIHGRSLWAIPWMEDDPALTSPQLWAGRMRRDAADALRYGCDGLLGIHWRTRVLSANVLSLARAAWDQGWNTLPRRVAEDVGPITGQYVSLKGKAIAGAGGRAAVYEDVRDRVFGYHLKVPNGVYAVTLQFVEGSIDRPRGRVFDVLVQGRKVADSVDIFARAGQFKALDLEFGGVEVADGNLVIDFADRIHYPALAGLVVSGKGFVKKINCGGPAVLDYEADWPETARNLDALDLYRDWARAQFGREAAEEIAAVFARIDGRHPVPVTWIGGPGNIQPDPRPWDEVGPAYAFADELAALESRIAGAGNRDRFGYWLASFRYMRDVARFNGLWAVYNKAIEKAKAAATEPARQDILEAEALPVRAKMAAALRSIFGSLLATVSTTGELGTIANWEQHLLPGAWERPGAELAKMLGRDLPADLALPGDYDGLPRIIVPAVRTSIEAGEPLALKVLVLTRVQPASVELHWRKMGRGAFRAIPLEHKARGVYTVTLPAQTDAVEYYLEIHAGGDTARFPVTAPALCQSVIVLPEGK
ncbi:MAG: malectin domain-containing carbohydrate-binding protein, partial [Candidatus Aminicenantes bacterium RBG_16_66_30]